jgi:hypothetical protein
VPVPGQARTRRLDQAKTSGHTFQKKVQNFVSPNFVNTLGAGLGVYWCHMCHMKERKKEKKERMFIYHFLTLNSIVSTAST